MFKTNFSQLVMEGAASVRKTVLDYSPELLTFHVATKVADLDAEPVLGIAGASCPEAKDGEQDPEMFDTAQLPLVLVKPIESSDTWSQVVEKAV